MTTQGKNHIKPALYIVCKLTKKMLQTGKANHPNCQLNLFSNELFTYVENLKRVNIIAQLGKFDYVFLRGFDSLH